MSTRISIYSLIALGFMIFQCSSSPVSSIQESAKTSLVNSANGFAVVELFTSQGCSSCPPADRKLNALTQKAKEQGTRIYTLAYHVDYWNRLGWKDPYSLKIFSDRQSWYSVIFEAGSVYTPQMIVNGEKEMVGSRNAEIDKAIDTAIAQNSNLEVQLVVESNKPETVCTVTLKNRPSSDCNICIALVADGVTTEVKRGENSGKTLEESGIVLHFMSKKLEIDGSKFVIPSNEISKNRRIVAFIQDATKGTIYGATDTKL